jgi:glycosyltransferase involved in cell wall biosynthesis
MRIGIDSRPTTHALTARRGIGRYVRGLFDALQQQQQQQQHSFPGVEVVWADEPTGDLDVWLASSPLQRCPILRHSGPKLAAVWYDCSPDADDAAWHRGSARWAWYCSVLDEVKHYPLVLTLSQHAKLDLVERHGFDPARIAVIGADCDARFRPARSAVDGGYDLFIVRRLGILGDFIVFVGGQDPRKGAHRLAQAWSLVPAEWRRGIQLVYAYEASASHRESVLSWGFRHGLKKAQGDPRLLAEVGLTPDIAFTGSVSDRDLVALYRRSLAAVYPSLYEGFGLPILEAARCGTPVIYGANTSQGEVLLGEGLPVDAADPMAIAGAIRSVLESPGFRRVISARGLEASRANSWATTAASALDALTSLIPCPAARAAV